MKYLPLFAGNAFVTATSCHQLSFSVVEFLGEKPLRYDIPVAELAKSSA